eukprot:UN01709
MNVLNMHKRNYLLLMQQLLNMIKKSTIIIINKTTTNNNNNNNNNNTYHQSVLYFVSFSYVCVLKIYTTWYIIICILSHLYLQIHTPSLLLIFLF